MTTLDLLPGKYLNELMELCAESDAVRPSGTKSAATELLDGSVSCYSISGLVPTLKAIIKAKDGNVWFAMLIAHYAAKAGERNTHFLIKQVICSQDESSDGLFVMLEKLMIAQWVPAALTKFGDDSYR